MAIRTNKSVTDNQQGRSIFHRKGVIDPEKRTSLVPTDIPRWYERSHIMVNIKTHGPIVEPKSSSNSELEATHRKPWNPLRPIEIIRNP